MHRQCFNYMYTDRGDSLWKRPLSYISDLRSLHLRSDHMAYRHVSLTDLYLDTNIETGFIRVDLKIHKLISPSYIK